MLNIAIVCYPTYGGSGVVATELGKALADQGHNIHFITYKQPFRLDKFHPNIQYHEVSFENYALFEFPPYETALASRMVEVCTNEKLDLIHVHYAIPHASAAFIAQQILKNKNIFIPFITTLHGTDITLVGKDKSFLPVVEFSINSSNGITAVSKSLKNDTYSYFDIYKDINVIPNFIDFKRFNKKTKDHFRKAIASKNEKILIHISNFRKVKRVEDVVKMFELIIKDIDCMLLMVGDGPERRKVEELAKDLAIFDKVKFLGKQEAIEELLAISDLFIMPSETESFGLAALEAMACEVPVIATNAGGLPEIITNGYNGYLSEVGDYKDMAINALSILKDESTLNRMKENAHTESLKYNIDNILPQYINCYNKVMEEFKEEN